MLIADSMLRWDARSRIMSHLKSFQRKGKGSSTISIVSQVPGALKGTQKALFWALLILLLISSNEDLLLSLVQPNLEKHTISTELDGPLRTKMESLQRLSNQSRTLLSYPGPQHTSDAWYRSATTSAGQKFNGGRSAGPGAGSRLRLIPFYTYFRSLKWTPIPISVGLALLAYQHYRRILRRPRSGDQSSTEEDSLTKDWEITCYRMMPWKGVSRAWGWVNNIDLPTWARQPVLNWYVTAFNCDLDEAEVHDLKSYKNLGEFFRRGLKTGARPVDQSSAIVSPADGKLLHFGRVEGGVIEQVKGVTYSLPVFLGPSTWCLPCPKEPLAQLNVQPQKLGSSAQFCSSILKQKANSDLFYCVIYLAPGDYHRFHSPVNWDVQFRRHFAGELLSVNPSVAGWIGGLFSLNERAVYVGNWEHGFFSMTAVGATNVGSIRVHGDEGLRTNSRQLKKNMHEDHWFSKPLTFEKGQEFGEFNLGSTIVLIFEAPTDFQWDLSDGTLTKVGQGLFHAGPAAATATTKVSS